MLREEKYDEALEYSKVFANFHHHSKGNIRIRLHSYCLQN